VTVRPVPTRVFKQPLELDAGDGTVPDLLAGTVESSSHYTLMERIGAGGMGVVYFARLQCEANIGKPVALKFLKGDLSEHQVEAFLQEASMTMALNHENIVDLYNVESFMLQSGGSRVFGRSDRQRPRRWWRRSRPEKKLYFMVMEYIDGPSARSLTHGLYRQKLMLPVPFAAFLISRVCRALQYAHNDVEIDGRPVSILHCDISPENVMVNSNGVVKLTDFGIAQAIRQTEEATTAWRGKAAYCSPEQRSGRPIDVRSDLFSLGVMACELVLGYHPFVPATEDFSDGRTVRRWMDAAGSREFISLSKLSPDIPEAVSTIIERAVAAKPDKRWQTAAQFGLALERDFLYAKGYGPTNDSLRDYVQAVYGETDRNRALERLEGQKSQLPFLTNAAGKFEPLRPRRYYRDVLERINSGQPPCLK